MQVEEYLIHKGIQYRRRGEELTCNCMFCGDKGKKFAINIITGLWNCKRATDCGLKGTFYDLQKKLGDNPERPKKSKGFVQMKRQVYKIPTEKVPVMTEEQKEVYQYLVGRGFSDETIKYFGIGANGNVVKFPYIKNDVLVNIKSRDITDKKHMWQERDAEPTLFNRDNIDSSEVLIIVEGEYDCMAFHQYGIQTVSVPNGSSGLQWVDGEWDFLETFKKILVCYDSDSAGRDGAMALSDRLGRWRCYIVTLPFKDANECLKNHVPRETIRECLDNAQEMNPETLVMPNFFTGKIQKLFEMGPRLYGTETAWPPLTKLLKGWRGGEVTIWTGLSGSGKSTILNQHFLSVGTKHEKTCVYSGEMPPERYLRWAVIQSSRNEHPDSDVVKETLEWMSGKIFILNVTDGITPEDMFRDFEYAARRYGVKHFIIDSLMKIRVNMADEYNAQKDFVSQLCDFSKKFNAHMHLVAHPRKPMTDRDEPGKVDVKGSSHITDLAHNVIVMYRADDEQKKAAIMKGKSMSDASLFLKKNREFGLTGKIYLSFDEKTKQFTAEE